MLSMVLSLRVLDCRLQVVPFHSQCAPELFLTNLFFIRARFTTYTLTTKARPSKKWRTCTRVMLGSAKTGSCREKLSLRLRSRSACMFCLLLCVGFILVVDVCV